MLGYDPFNVREVEPDFEVGREGQGMKTVDYAVKKDGAPIMLFQCAEAKTDLDDFEDHFLFDVFDDVEADVVVFTNGLSYHFFVNLPVEVGAQTQPFLEFNLLDYTQGHLETLERLSKPMFDSEHICSAAHELHSSRLLRGYLSAQAEAPDDRLVRFLATQVYGSGVSDEVLDRFRPVVQKVLEGAVDEEDAISVPDSDTEKEEGAPPSEEDIELSSSDGEPVENQEEGTEEQRGPFDKDLARRVIEDF